ncbi:hypothetical protein EXIGLDRAFT_705293 [Exidia glandulosa HHB12029]|uniref:Uncharacterized protein n=1 Tax=Exidia glandulosa HHB12029 TaxID=1314781 RepID=A0A166BNG6_EXIGL|nr:hypothetical protein EXIGLDRAFT_705293 [Exidia glandulosa HHB12029]
MAVACANTFVAVTMGPYGNVVSSSSSFVKLGTSVTPRLSAAEAVGEVDPKFEYYALADGKVGTTCPYSADRTHTFLGRRVHAPGEGERTFGVHAFPHFRADDDPDDRDTTAHIAWIQPDQLICMFTGKYTCNLWLAFAYSGLGVNVGAKKFKNDFTVFVDAEVALPDFVRELQLHGSCTRPISAQNADGVTLALTPGQCGTAGRGLGIPAGSPAGI